MWSTGAARLYSPSVSMYFLSLLIVMSGFPTTAAYHATSVPLWIVYTCMRHNYRYDTSFRRPQCGRSLCRVRVTNGPVADHIGNATALPSRSSGKTKKATMSRGKGYYAHGVFSFHQNRYPIFSPTRRRGPVQQSSISR